MISYLYRQQIVGLIIKDVCVMQTVKEESYQAIFRKYYPRMYYYAKRIVGEDAADDVVQEGFLELWNRMDALDTEGPQIESYLYKTVYSRALNYLKRYKKINTAALEDINEMRMSCYLSSMGDGEHDMENAELNRKINQAISELPDKCREIFVLSYLKDMKNSEIALMMNVSVRTVEAHIYKALKMLRSRLGIIFLFFLFFLDN